MNKLVAIDPGLRKCGVAEFTDGILIRAYLVKGPKTGRGPAAWLVMALEVANRLSPHFHSSTWTLAIEQMDFNRRSDGRPADLGELCGVSGALTMCSGIMNIVSYLPSRWKKGVPKKIHNQRVLARLDAGERRSVPKDHNVIDAVGIGLYHCGRYRP